SCCTAKSYQRSILIASPRGRLEAPSGRSRLALQVWQKTCQDVTFEKSETYDAAGQRPVEAGPIRPGKNPDDARLLPLPSRSDGQTPDEDGLASRVRSEASPRSFQALLLPPVLTID